MPWATVPLCKECWDAEHDYLPVAVAHDLLDEPETCHKCKAPTLHGIYIRAFVTDHPADDKP